MTIQPAEHSHPHDHQHPHEHSHPHEHRHPHETSQSAREHDHPHPHGQPRGLVNRRTLLGAGGLGLGAMLLAACTPTALVSTATPSAVAPSVTPTATPSATAAASPTLAGFDEFADTVRTFLNGEYWMVESTGLPAHSMMVGITSWQQQFPLPQPFIGDNAFRLPVTPQLAATPVSARTGLFRGAIALAVNGVPIFNALNNRGDDAFLAGELDQWGGHCGKADDYHYHVAPLHLQDAVGAAKPIAYALDGYAIYGLTEPDGRAVAALDEFNGHTNASGLYHYHGTQAYPYINGGLVGVVGVSGDGVDTQPNTPPIRPPGEPLRGATITGFESLGAGSYRLDYTLDGETLQVAYQVTDAEVAFTFSDATGVTRTETYSR
ncbi:YHYH protein [Salinibacterium sp.]|uniref:YHYH protein n=1 Tax=Salinibacterium sp. TaxID=1915057 RepID=UPI00286ACB31|nr:YHYH protein [Salinibacterium sp.]